MEKISPIRNNTLDIIKGILIILACSEHFSEHINNFFIDSTNSVQITNIFLRPTIVPIYSFYLQDLGQFIYPDKVQQFFHTLLIPWVTHLYIAIAGFNLAKYDFNNDHKLYNKKLKLFGLLFFVFYIESFLVSTNYGFALSIHPIQMWFIILAILSVLSRFLTNKSITTLFIVLIIIKLLLNTWFKKISDDFSLNQVIKLIHPWSFSTEFVMFMISGLSGFIYARYSQLLNLTKSKLFSIIISVNLLIAIFINKKNFIYNKSNIYEYEEYFNNINPGVYFLIAIIVFCIHFANTLPNLKLPSFFSFLTYCGKNILGIFLFHRVIFIKIIFPIKFHLFSYFSISLTNLWWEILIYVGLTILLYSQIPKLKFLLK